VVWVWVWVGGGGSQERAAGVMGGCDGPEGEGFDPNRNRPGIDSQLDRIESSAENRLRPGLAAPGRGGEGWGLSLFAPIYLSIYLSMYIYIYIYISFPFVSDLLCLTHLPFRPASLSLTLTLTLTLHFSLSCLALPAYRLAA
jgi:hypothetical protein